MTRNGDSHDPDATTPTGLHVVGLGIFRVRSPLLAESLLLSFPGVTEMFHFTPLAAQTLCVQVRADRALPLPGFPIRTSPGQSLLATHRGFSQLATSFIAS